MTDVSGDPDAAELARLQQEVNILAARTEQARQAWVAADSILRATLRQRDGVALRLQAAALGQASPLGAAGTRAGAPAEAPQVAGAPTGSAGAPPGTMAPPSVAAPGFVSAVDTSQPETSMRTVQNVLFVLGGLLLGTAAIVFAAVAWATYGETGRALILAAVTVLALTVPLLALRRSLHATAETFAGIGLLLVILDGYAAWYVDLFGVTTIGGWTYAAAVCAVTSLVGVAYRTATRLVGPGFVAIMTVQPVLPLLAAEWRPSAAGWSAVFSAVAALNLVLVLRSRHASGTRAVAVRVVGWTGYAGSLAVAIAVALAAQLLAETTQVAAWAGAAMVLCGLIHTLGAALGGSSTWRALAGCLLILAIAESASLVVAIAWPAYLLVLVAAVVTIVAVGVRIIPTIAGTALAQFRPGARAGALVAAGALSLTTTTMALIAAVRSAATALPLWTADLHVETPFTWQLLAALGLALVALLAVAPRTAGAHAAVLAAVLAVLALPGCVALAWWAPPVVDIAAASILVASLVAGRFATLAAWPRATGAAVLTAHAAITCLARPELTASVLGGIAIVGVALGFSSRTDGSANAAGGCALGVGLLAVPPAVGSWLVAVDVVPWWVARASVGSVALVLLILVAVRRRRPRQTWYALGAALVSAVIWPFAFALGDIEPMGIYAALGLLAIAASLLASGRTTISAPPGAATTLAAIGAVPPATLFAVAVVPAVVAVVVLPYSWLSAVWSGVPAGVGLATADALDVTAIEVTYQHAIALGLLALAAATASYALTGRRSAAVAGLGVGGPTAILVTLVAAQAPWPTTPAVTLALGLIIVMAGALVRIGPWRTALVTTQGLAYIGAGLSGALSAQWLTLAALGSTLVAAAVVGALGRGVAWRVIGYLTAVAAALATAIAASFVADLGARNAAFVVLGAAVVALAVGTVLGGGESRRARRPESVAIQAAAHAGAVVALMFTIGHVRHAAAVCALWGLAVGVRALWPGTSAAARRGLVAAAAASELLGWWLVLASRSVALLEAYTLPLALVALLAGFAATRARPEIRSWIAYGPALCAAFLPTLGSVLVVTGEPWRRLLLLAGSIAVVLIGSTRRLQAPVVVGGLSLAVLALHEIVLVWDLVPRWIPLAIGGLLLLGLAITYERRRRDLARLRLAVAQMR